MNTVISRFLEHAQARPGAPCMLDIRGMYTADEVLVRSAYLAERMLDLAGGTGKRIAVLLPRIRDFGVALVAVIRAGCALVPIDGEYPAERVRRILTDAGCALCLTTGARAGDASAVPVLLLEDVFPESWDAAPENPLLDLSDPDAEGYIVYTSGSTGRPKGVVHRQSMLDCAPAALADIIPMGPDCRALNISGFSFIACSMDFFPMLASGGSVYIADEAERKNTDMLYALFEKRGITGLFMPPRLYDIMRRLYGPLPLRYVLMGGEKSSASEADPGVWEVYGSSEAAAPVLLNPPGRGGPASLGRPAPGVSLCLVDDDGNRIEAPGEIGELCVSSPWLAIGYNGLPEETGERFAENPFRPGERMYRTGDYMARDEAGNYIFHGRKDRMVKIRGYRVELGEIDHVLLQLDGVSEAASVSVRVNGEDHIAAYLAPGGAAPSELKDRVRKSLPDYMVPDFFVSLPSLPRNSRGKVDYPLLKSLEINREDAEYEPPRTDLEEKVCRACAEALGLERFSAAADFFDYGGTSLSAAVLISRLEGCSLSFQDVSAHPTPRALAGYLESQQDSALPAMDRESYPLTKTQMGIYLESLTGGSRETYTVSYLARAAENVSADSLVQAVHKVLAAHPGMKYMIRTDRSGMPRMFMAPDAPLEIPVFEGTEEGRLDFAARFMPVVPMMDSLLIHPAVYRTPERCYLALKTHLIFFDASSISLFISEINRALAGLPLEGEECTVQQAGMIEERLMLDGSHDRARDYYRNLFRDMEDLPALSGDLNGPLTPGVSRNLRFEPGTLASERVKAFCDRIRVSESAFFQGAMALLLSKYLNSRRVSFSTVYNGRPLAEMNRTIGTLIKRIPVYGDLSRDLSVADYLRGISRQLFSTMASDIFSFDEVLKAFPVNEDVEFIYQGDLFTDRMGAGAGTDLLQADSWFMEHYHTGMVTGCMSIQFFSTGGRYNMTVEYRNEKFTEAWVRRFAQDLFTTAEQLLTVRNISEVSLLTEEDRAQLASFNDTAVPIAFLPVQEQIHRRALEKPGAAAVTAAGRTLSFRDLDLLSSRLAQALRLRGVVRGSLVGVLFDRSVWAYVAEQAVLKAGGAFIPFIPDYPDERIAFCMEDAGARLLLTARDMLSGRDLSGRGFEALTLEEAFGAARPDDIRPDEAFPAAPLTPVGPEDLAYCIYTSGSTGRPKGVLIEHRNIANYVHRNEKSLEIMHYAAPGRVCLALASFSFDVSVVEEFVPLCNGNPVVIATEAEIHDPSALARLIRETGVSGITCTPTYLMSLLDIPESREAIRQLTFFDIGAEAFPRQLYDRLRELRDDSVILNVYGPTECTMGCSAAIMSGGENVTVGPPIANTVFQVADSFGNPLPVGLRGELIICGDQVGRGYVGLPEKTAEAFFVRDGLRAYHSGDLAAWDASGEIRIFGRLDNQIKLRGFRIELDEIEKVMAEFPGVLVSAAAVRKAGSTEYLAGYFTASGDVPADRLRQRLQEKLPEYMVPSVLTRLDEMPMTVNGKVDRRALPDPDLKELRAEYVPPVTETEKILCAAFARTTGLPENEVGLLSDFFDLGGDSLKAMVALSEAQLDGLTAADIFRLRTPGAIAKELGRRAGRGSLEEREAAARLADHPVSPMQIEMIDHQLFRPDSTMWSNMHFLARFGPSVDADRLCAAVNRALANHPALSVAFFFNEDSELRQQYRPGLLPEVRVRDILPETEDALGDILILPFRKFLDACLCKVNVFRGRKGCYLFLDVHHLLMDGGSLGVLLRDVANAYFGRPLEKDYYFALLAEEEQQAAAGAVERSRAYFRENYGDTDWCVIPDPDHESANINQAGRIRRLSFGAGDVAAAEAFWGVSHSVMAVSAGLLALSRFTGRSHVMINWIFNNRLAPEAGSAVGMLIKNLPAAARMENISSARELLLSVKEQVAEGIAHSAWDFMTETRVPYVNDCMEINLQLGINADELDELHPEFLPLADEFSAAGARLEMELLENEYGDGAFDSEMEYAEGLFDAPRMERFHDLYVQILESLIRQEDPL